MLCVLTLVKVYIMLASKSWERYPYVERRTIDSPNSPIRYPAQ